MPNWLPLLIAVIAGAVGCFALLRANRVDAAMRRALAALPTLPTLPAHPAPQATAPPQVQADHVITMPDVQGPLCRVAVVRFDAFADISGLLSAATALLDDNGNGLVITALNGREVSRSYLKSVRAGVGVVALSPEESDAVQRALGSKGRVA